MDLKKQNVKKLNNTKSFLKVVLSGFLLFLMSKPYFVWHNSAITLCSLFFILWGCICLFSKKMDLKVLLFVFTYMLLSYINGLYEKLNINGAIFSVIFPLMLFIPIKKRVRILISFTNIYAVLIFISLVVFMLVNILNVTIPSTEIGSLNVLKGYTYRAYPLLAMPDVFVFSLPRFPAFFDEPGVVGTISVILLLTFGKNLNKFSYISILLSGIFSFSLYFYLTFILYLITVIDIKRVILTLVLSSSLVAVYPPFTKYFDSYIMERLAKNQNGSIEGDNRVSEEFNAEYQSFLKSPLLLYGKGESMISLGDSSYKTIIYSRGLIFFIGIFLFYTLYALLKLRKIRSVYIFFLLFLGITYQRPFYFDPFYFFILLTMVDYFQFNDNFKIRNYASSH